MRRSQSSVTSMVPELPGLSDRHNLVEESIDDLVQGKYKDAVVQSIQCPEEPTS